MKTFISKCTSLLAGQGRIGGILSIAVWLAISVSGSTSFLSYTGTLATPQSDFAVSFVLSATDDITIQTWGFGGGTNANGELIAPGGFDPLIAFFAGDSSNATIYIDGSGNPFADADSLLIGPPAISFVGNCPAAGTVLIGTGTGSDVCGDDLMQITGVPAGVYTVVLSTALDIPIAVDPGTPDTLAAGFTDLSMGADSFVSGGVTPYQTCNFPSDQPSGICINPTGDWALDITGTASDLSTAPGSAPEPATGWLAGVAMAALGWKRLEKLRKTNKGRVNS